MSQSRFKFQFVNFNSLVSTNIYALQLLQTENVAEGLVVRSNFQEKGKGQVSQKWESESGKNLLMSVVLKPEMSIENRFDLSKMVALAIQKALVKLSVNNVTVKWPNDILVGNKKIAGILIENSLTGKTITNSIIGVGVNVNQVSFSEFNRVATSLHLELNQKLDIDAVMNAVLEQLKVNYEAFLEGYDFSTDYLNNLYGYGKPLRYVDADSEFIGVILGVLPDGRIQLNKNGKLKSYDLKEIKCLD